MRPSYGKLVHCNDKVIMESLILGGMTRLLMTKLNKIVIHFKVNALLDICNSTGLGITTNVWEAGYADTDCR